MRFVARPREAVADITIVGAYAFEVTARIMPGLPRSSIRGGRSAGVDVISKSGTFGAPTLWRRLVSENQPIFERHDTRPVPTFFPSPWAIPPGSARRSSSRHARKPRSRIEACDLRLLIIGSGAAFRNATAQLDARLDVVEVRAADKEWPNLCFLQADDEGSWSNRACCRADGGRFAFKDALKWAS